MRESLEDAFGCLFGTSLADCTTVDEALLGHRYTKWKAEPAEPSNWDVQCSQER